jgi:hypothetical protein
MVNDKLSIFLFLMIDVLISMYVDDDIYEIFQIMMMMKKKKKNFHVFFV